MRKNRHLLLLQAMRESVFSCAVFFYLVLNIRKNLHCNPILKHIFLTFSEVNFENLSDYETWLLLLFILFVFLLLQEKLRVTVFMYSYFSNNYRTFVEIHFATLKITENVTLDTLAITYKPESHYFHKLLLFSYLMSNICKNLFNSTIFKKNSYVFYDESWKSLMSK